MKKTLSILLAVVLIVAISVAGTFAFLTATSNDVTNTFAAGELLKGEFELKEHKADEQADGSYILLASETEANDYTVLPGVNIPKDPFLRFTNTENAYLFIEIADSLPEGCTWAIDEGWTELMDGGTQVTGSHGGKVYVRSEIVAPVLNEDSVAQQQTVNILRQNTDAAGKTTAITVADTFTAMVPAPEEPEALNFYGYICQSTGVENALGAWKANFVSAP